MQTTVEVQIGDGRDKPKVIKQSDGTFVVATLPPNFVQDNRAIWVQTFRDGQSQDGKGFLINGKNGNLYNG